MSDSEIDSFVKLGLTTSEAKVYLTLIRTGPSSARLISEKSNIARPDVYRLLGILQEKGLVGRELDVPTIFSATPLREASATLIQLKKRDLNKLQVEMHTVINEFEKRQKNFNESVEDCQFKIIPANNAFINRIRDLTHGSTEITETLMPVTRILQAIPFFESTIIDAHNRGVRTRLISESIPEKAVLRKIETTYLEAKFATKQLSIGFCIFERKSAVILSSPKSSFPKCNGLWSNSPTIVQLAANYFDNLWKEL